jgi:hypothetical protein
MSEPRRPEARPRRGFTYQLVGWVMAIAGGCIGFVSLLAGGQASGTSVLLVLVLAVGGFSLVMRGRRYSTPIGEPSDDPRPPVIYLRSFQDEAHEASVTAFFRDAFTGEQLAGDIPHSGPTEQLLLSQFFSTIGPYEALGNPAEVIPHTGARHIYKAHDTWQADLSPRLDRARLVIVHAGATPGLQWEIGYLIRRIAPMRVLLLMTGRRGDYEAFLEWAKAIFPKPFPVKPGSRLVSFDESWTPVVLPARGTLTETLAPWLRKNGIPMPSWKPSYRPR